MTDLEQRVAEIERRVGKPNRPAPAPVEPSLAQCNAVAQRAWDEHKGEKRTAQNVAVEAIKSAFRTHPGRAPVRAQKAISPVGAELAAAATKK